MSFQAAIRAAVVTLLTEYAADAEITLQVYPGRPLSLYPPSAFVDGIRETIIYSGFTLRQRTPIVEVIVVHGTFDSAETVAQRDAFVDGFLDWVTARYHAAGANTTIGLAGVSDIPSYVPDWLPPDKQRVFFATQLTLEGLSLDGTSTLP